MKSITIGTLVLVSISLIGCKATSEGAKEDIRDNSINASAKVKEGMDSGSNMAANAASDIKDAGANLSAAARLTPRIKNAINAEPSLNVDGNMIDVDTTDDQVTLKGHVLNEDLKKLAGKLATEELSKSKAKQKLVNELEVKAKGM